MQTFFFGKTPGTSLTGFRVSGAGCRRVPGFYKVLIWGGRGRSAPRVSSGIERGLPPKFAGTSTFEVASSVSSEAPSSIERRVARICSTSPFDFDFE